MGFWGRITSCSENENPDPDIPLRLNMLLYPTAVRYARCQPLDPAIRDRFTQTSRQMEEADGSSFAAHLLEEVLQRPR